MILSPLPRKVDSNSGFNPFFFLNFPTALRIQQKWYYSGKLQYFFLNCASEVSLMFHFVVLSKVVAYLLIMIIKYLQYCLIIFCKVM